MFIPTLLKHLTHTPTSDQQKLAEMFDAFFKDPAKRKAFLLKGYAGTGKTTFINALSRTLPGMHYNIVLLAPTGRASKVITSYSGLEAQTIHKKIYAIESDKNGAISIKLNRLNKKPNTVYIVDEASMIASQTDKTGLFGERNLLSDLFDFVYGIPNCFIVFSGDTAQLPPVNEEESKSLDATFIGAMFYAKVYQFELKEVVRQAKESGILMNATALRILVNRKENFPVLKSNGFPDVEVLYGSDISDKLQDKFGSRHEDEVLVVCRSNKQANKYNQYIRNSILGLEEEISSGDSMMVVKNNYYWLEDGSQAKFIANGDIIRIKRIFKTEEKFGFRFATVLISMVDYPDEKDMEVKLLLDTITRETPSLSQDESKKIFNKIASTYMEPNGKIKYKKVFRDPYLNALQVKFSYAVTCHKAQGGQWNDVFVDSGYMKEEQYNPEYLRWLYTAVTRAKKKLYLVNMHERFFKK